jgi:divalent metal cation (Fe/Co/Zn/Cd) transporter
MSSNKIESLVSWFFVGGALLGVGFFLFWESWRALHLGVPFRYRGHETDPAITMRGAVFFSLIGLGLIIATIIAKLRSSD